MMTNLFSVFDPSTQIFSLPLNWVSPTLSIFFLPWLFWVAPNRSQTFTKTIVFTLHNEFKVLLGATNVTGSTFILIGLFVFLVFNNFLGLFPYIFTASSHLVFTLALSLPLWVSFMMFGWVNHARHMFAHLVPAGTPMALMSFMVCIETISNLIRPGTLAVRLAANMIAGHLLLTLLSNNAPNMAFLMINLLLLTQILLLVLESAVAIIQSYVFAVLSTLYSSETSYVNS